MKIVVFCGGTGKRFWPASRAKSPKQFLNVIGDKPLVRLKYEYLRLGFKPEDFIISTGIQYKTEIEAIFPEIPSENFIYEPDMRDNGPAVAYAAAYVKQRFKDNIISIQWSDHFVKNPEIFTEAIIASGKSVERTGTCAIIGEFPRFPTPNRGYIKYGNKKKSLTPDGSVVLAEFMRFVEKPDSETAVEYIQSGDYLWNTGYSTINIDFLMEKYRKFAPEMYAVIQNIASSNFNGEALKEYSTLDKVGYDTIVSENLSSEDAEVLITHMGWSDIGEWDALKETLQNSREEIVTNGLVEDLDSTDSIIYNYDGDRLIATIGLEGYAVINTKDITAIINLKHAHKIKKLLPQIEKNSGDKYL